MKVKLLLQIIIIIINLDVYSSEKFLKGINGDYSYRIQEISSEFGINDVTELVTIVQEISLSREARMSAIKIINEMNHPALFPYLKTLQSKLTNRMLANLNERENREIYVNDYKIRAYALEAIGRLATPKTGNFLIDLYNNKKWKNSPNDKVQVIIDDQFVLPILNAIGEAAVYNKQYFSFLENEVRKVDDPLKKNLKRVIEVYREKYYKKTPAEINGKDYAMSYPNDPNQAIDYTLWFIQQYHKKHKKLPSSILDLTIKNGGDYYYLRGDVYNKHKDGFLVYKWLHGQCKGSDCWTFILLSVGPNQKIDVELSKLKLGIDNEDTQTVFQNTGDDIFKVISYYGPPKSLFNK
ncbi:hypothetical protein GF373_09495 [bacterium]|nr:hypothetical protein [bacterium]